MVHPCFPEDQGFIFQANNHRFHLEDLSVIDVLQSTRYARKEFSGETEGDIPRGFLGDVSAETTYDYEDDCWGAWSPDGLRKDYEEEGSYPASSSQGPVAPAPQIRPPGMPEIMPGAADSAGSVDASETAGEPDNNLQGWGTSMMMSNCT